MRKRATEHRLRGQLTRALTRPPFRDEFGQEGWFEKISGSTARHSSSSARSCRLAPMCTAAAHRVPRRFAYRLAFERCQAPQFDNRRSRDFTPDLALFGGDYVNMQLIGGGRVPPHTIAAVLSRLEASLGRFAVLGNHDYVYGERAVSDALRDRKITVLDRDRSTLQFHNYSIQIAGVPDGCINSDKACSPTG